MKLSRLIFECVKDSINIPNFNFDEFSFLAGDFNTSKDYSSQISGVFDSVNLALARLYDSNKISYATEEMTIESNNFKFDKGEIVNIVVPYKSSYRRLEFRTLEFGTRIKIFETKMPLNILVEFKKRIPHFTEIDLKSIVLDEENKIIVQDNNIELLEYGITDYMCAYIKSFVKGQLMEYLAPDLANMHNNRAEQYFQNIQKASTAFTQNQVRTSFRGY